MNIAADLFRLLGDASRLRILRLLSREKLNVSELTIILGQAQSGISRHLKLLKEAGLLSEHRESGWSYYGVEPERFADGLQRLWPPLLEQMQSMDRAREDDAGLAEVLRQRQEDFRTKPEQRASAPGRSWGAWARTLGYLAPHCVVADLGCGEGFLTLEVARWARKVIAVDSSEDMLAKARKLARRHGVGNITWKRAAIEKLPIAAGAVEVVLMSQLLHCIPEPALALREAHRILAPAGTLLLQELRAHQEEWVRERYGDIWLGFEEKQLKEMLQQAGFRRVQTAVGARRHGDPFVVLIGSGRKSK